MSIGHGFASDIRAGKKGFAVALLLHIHTAQELPVHPQVYWESQGASLVQSEVKR